MRIWRFLGKSTSPGATTKAPTTTLPEPWQCSG